MPYRLKACSLVLSVVLVTLGALAQSRNSGSPLLISRQLGGIRHAGYGSYNPHMGIGRGGSLSTISSGALPSEARGNELAAGLLPSERRGRYLATGKSSYGNLSGSIRYGGLRRGYGRRQSDRFNRGGIGTAAVVPTGPVTVSMSRSLARPMSFSSAGSIRHASSYTGMSGYAARRGGGFARYGRSVSLSMTPPRSSSSYLARPIGGTIRYRR